MQTRLPLTVICLLQCQLAIADKELPPSPPPSVGIARASEKGIELREGVTRFVKAVRTRKVPFARVVDGKRVTEFREEQYTVHRMVLEHTQRKLPTGKYSLYDMAGKVLPDQDHAELLKKERVVLISTDGKPVPEFYRKLYRPEILIVVAPRTPFSVPLFRLTTPVTRESKPTPKKE